MIKILQTSLAILVLAILAPSAHAEVNVLFDPPCENTKCMSMEAYWHGQHLLGEAPGRDIDSGAVPGLAGERYIELDWFMALRHDLSWEHDCGIRNVDPTGVTVLKQVPATIFPFADSFCTIQGCVGSPVAADPPYESIDRVPMMITNPCVP